MPLDPMTRRPAPLQRPPRHRGPRLGLYLALALALATPAQPPADHPAPTARTDVARDSPVDEGPATTR